MTILQIEHPIYDFDTWKATFDSDPTKRKESGMRGYRILRPADDPKYVIVDCEFDSTREAEAFLAKMREAWRRVVGKIIDSPQARMSVVSEARQYVP
jgi:hypothetical protein